MDGISFLALAAACAPLVDASTTQAIVAVESSFNPNAIGVVAGVLARQPRSAEEALSTARALQVDRWNFSLGLAQINVHNLRHLRLPLPDAFDGCKNLEAMQTLLGECHARVAVGTTAQLALRQTLSCYYGGNFTTGFRDGYVRRVVDTARRYARAPP
jgi:type IV secretion system protein VirB1